MGGKRTPNQRFFSAPPPPPPSLKTGLFSQMHGTHNGVEYNVDLMQKLFNFQLLYLITWSQTKSISSLSMHCLAMHM